MSFRPPDFSIFCCFCLSFSYILCVILALIFFSFTRKWIKTKHFIYDAYEFFVCCSFMYLKAHLSSTRGYLYRHFVWPKMRIFSTIVLRVWTEGEKKESRENLNWKGIFLFFYSFVRVPHHEESYVFQLPFLF